MIGMFRSVAVRFFVAALAFVALGALFAASGCCSCAPPGSWSASSEATLAPQPPPDVGRSPLDEMLIAPAVIADNGMQWSGVYEIGEAGTCVYAEGGAIIRNPCTGAWWLVPPGAVVAWADPR